MSAILSQQMIPSARRLMESLRDIGYDLPAAVADLVDNSLDANASNVTIRVAHDRDGGWVRVADDGVGMTEGELDEAMRYGSSRRYDGRDLGYFGLGLKTASLSQCRRLTVATRSAPAGRIRIRRWDLDHVARTDSWDLERLGVRDAPSAVLEPLAGVTGTAVLWEGLDRIHGARRPGGDAAARRLEGAAAEIAEHLSMVFHRFLSDEAPGAPLIVHVNGERLEAWDPYARSEPLTQVLPVQRLPLEYGGTTHEVIVQPYLLPSQHHFSDAATHELAGGPKRWNRQQGLYIYRRDRLIQSGGWNRLRTLDEHAKLARISVEIPPEADSAFRTNVAKMSIALPDALRPALRALAAGVVARAQDVYRRRMRVVPHDLDAGLDDAKSSRGSRLTVGDQWPAISEALAQELGHDAALLDRVLVALANLRPGGPEIDTAVNVQDA
jgi:hypothetical protein